MKHADTTAKQVYYPLNAGEWCVAFLPGGFALTA